MIYGTVFARVGSIWTEVGMHPFALETAHLPQGIRVAFGIWNLYTFPTRPSAVSPPFFLFLTVPPP